MYSLFSRFAKNKMLLLLVFFLFNLYGNIEVKLNKLTASIIFTEALMDKSGRPKELKKIYKENYPSDKKLEATLREIKPLYKKLRVSRIYNHPKTRRLFSAIMIESTFTNDIDVLENKILSYKLGVGKKLIRTYFAGVKQFIPIYEKLIWEPNYEKLLKAKNQIEGLIEKLKKDDVQRKVENFYHIKQKDVRPFYVNLYPIPGGKGFKALRIENTAPVGIIINDRKLNLNWFFSAVVFHEQCHEYFAQYKEQIRQMIKDNKPSGAKNFLRTFDESLQTAIGAGYTYNKLTNKLSKGKWYNNKVYDNLAKKIYKEVSFYLNNNKRIDEEFIKKTINEYKKN